MRSVRLGDELEHRLQEAARVTGQPASKIIRDAVRKQCEELLGDRLSERLADVIGAVGSSGGQSRRTGKQFTELLQKARTKKKQCG